MTYSEILASINRVKNRLDSYAGITFTNYLRGGLEGKGGASGAKQVMALGTATVIILGTIFQSGLAARSTSAIIIASIPTATATPTHTWIPTLTLTPLPTVTLTPTITSTFTYTPSSTATATITITPTITSTRTMSPTSTETKPPTITLPPIAGASCIPKTNRDTGIVSEVVDGDTIKVNIDGNIYSVRYIGIDAPETEVSSEYFGSQATSRNRTLVDGRKVYLFKDVSNVDRYDRLLRYVVVGTVFVNYEMMRSGFAFASTYPPDVACSIAFIGAEKAARTGKFGLWAPTPTPIVRSNPGILPTSPGGNYDPSYPTVCIPPYPPDLDCPEIPFDDFKVLQPDPHGFDGDKDGIGCET